jgi:hypothetical protein
MTDANRALAKQQSAEVLEALRDSRGRDVST